MLKPRSPLLLLPLFGIKWLLKMSGKYLSLWEPWEVIKKGFSSPFLLVLKVIVHLYSLRYGQNQNEILEGREITAHLSMFACPQNDLPQGGAQ